MNDEVKGILDEIKAATEGRVSKLEEDLKKERQARGLAEERKMQALLSSGSSRAGEVLHQMETAEQQRFSIGRAMAFLANPRDNAGGFEAEVSSELRQRLTGLNGIPPEAILIPMETRLNVPVHRRELTVETGSPTTGSDLVGTSHASQLFIDILRSRSIAMSLGPTPLDAGRFGLQNISIPKKTQGTTAYWFAADSSAHTITSSDVMFSSISLAPKFVAGLTSASYRVALQGDPRVDAMIFSDLAETLGTAIDDAFFEGTGSSNQPLGILNRSINSVALGSPSLLTWDAICRLEEEIAKDNAPNQRRSYVCHPSTLRLLKTTLKVDADAGGGWLIEPNGRMNGYPVAVSSHFPAADNQLLFGDFSEAIWATWGAIALLRDPYTHFDSGSVRYRAIMPVDYDVRHEESFAKTV